MCNRGGWHGQEGIALPRRDRGLKAKSYFLFYPSTKLDTLRQKEGVGFGIKNRKSHIFLGFIYNIFLFNFWFYIMLY
jgi:hypothetical protein